mmetsp:Transcript_33224/g.78796  ORF Transcript_33224/g.78796 Transcript_33224/m.78796 type:complete len:244 (+) Transcript_33224:2724-3455(+)
MAPRRQIPGGVVTKPASAGDRCPAPAGPCQTTVQDVSLPAKSLATEIFLTPPPKSAEGNASNTPIPVKNTSSSNSNVMNAADWPSAGDHPIAFSPLIPQEKSGAPRMLAADPSLTFAPSALLLCAPNSDENDASPIAVPPRMADTHWIYSRGVRSNSILVYLTEASLSIAVGRSCFSSPQVGRSVISKSIMSRGWEECNVLEESVTSISVSLSVMTWTEAIVSFAGRTLIVTAAGKDSSSPRR